MSADKHPAEVLADKQERLEFDEPYSTADMLRRIPALEADLDATNIRLREVATLCATVEAERDQLRAEVEALRADAERYRWLRGYRFIWTKFLNGDKAVALEFGFFRTNSQKPERTDLDAAIDEARKQQ